MTISAIIAGAVLVLIVAVAAYATRRENDNWNIRKAFGPEYDRVRTEYGGARAADRELARRIRVHDELRLEPVSTEEQDSYAMSWERIQGGFLDDPAVALRGAERLVTLLLAARGYPATDRGEQLALLSVQHGNTLVEYRQAQWTSERLRVTPSRVTTEQMRTALMQYQAFFEELLLTAGTATPRRIQQTEATP